MAVQIEIRRGSAANWASTNPIPAQGEPCYETDTRRQKIGDGILHYNNLPYSQNIEKRGLVSAVSFSGSPLKATVSFGTAFPDTNYAIKITGVDERVWTYETKTAGGFVINANAAFALSGEVSWSAEAIGEN